MKHHIKIIMLHAYEDNRIAKVLKLYILVYYIFC